MKIKRAFLTQRKITFGPGAEKIEEKINDGFLHWRFLGMNINGIRKREKKQYMASFSDF